MVFIRDCVGRLCDRLRSENHEQPVENISRIMNHLTFDILGEIGFAQDYGMIDNGKDHTLVHFVEKAMHAVSIIAEIPWVMPILNLLPLGKDQAELDNLSMKTTLNRFAKGNSRRDLFSHFVQEDGQLHPDMEMKDLDADVRVMIIAGSDTSASVLAFILEYLSQHSKWMKRLRDEVNANHQGHGEINLDRMPVLEAVMNETLRLRPPGPGRSQRVVPAGGTIICGQYIPAGTLVGVPLYSILRDERYFAPYPERWRPERWLNPDKEDVFRRSAFIPFLVGPFNCAGKNLALLMMRYILATLILEFDITAAPQHDPVEFERSIKEYFTVQKGPFWAVVKPRDA